jgi:hypothetical protein
MVCCKELENLMKEGFAWSDREITGDVRPSVHFNDRYMSKQGKEIFINHCPFCGADQRVGVLGGAP